MVDSEELGEQPSDEAGFPGLTAENYQQLKQIAFARLRNQRSGITLNCTALVHEAYLKIFDSAERKIDDEGHFLAIASLAMRQILVDYARAKNAGKRGSGALHVTLQESLVADEQAPVNLLELDAALTRLADKDATLGQLVALRFFGGLSMEQTALAIGKSKRSVERDWTRARIYLFRELERHDG